MDVEITLSNQAVHYTNKGKQGIGELYFELIITDFLGNYISCIRLISEKNCRLFYNF